LIIDENVYLILVLLSGITYALLMSLPFSIAFFYHKVFKKKAYPYLFLVSGILFSVSLIYSYNIFSVVGSGFFAAGGIVLAAASIRLYIVMMGW
jgi:hypothetical protein